VKKTNEKIATTGAMLSLQTSRPALSAPGYNNTFRPGLHLPHRAGGLCQQSIRREQDAVLNGRLRNKDTDERVFMQLKPDQARAAYHARLMQELSQAPAGSSR